MLNENLKLSHSNDKFINFELQLLTFKFQLFVTGAFWLDLALSEA